jgi:Ala-tRNA(Pro) deacylase
MYLAHRVASFLHQRDVNYDMLTHRHSRSSRASAALSHIPRRTLAKGVLFNDDDDFLLAVVPATCRVDASALCDLMGATRLELANENELPLVFNDCEAGAIPPLGTPYGVESIVDASLLVQEDVYFEGGDHEHLVHVRGADFRRLMAGVRRAVIAYPD